MAAEEKTVPTNAGRIEAECWKRVADGQSTQSPRCDLILAGNEAPRSHSLNPLGGERE